MFWKPIGAQRRFTFGVRGELDYVHPFGSTTSENLPIFERLFTGGEYSVRGYDIRSIGPRDVGTPEQPGTFIVLGGNKLALFNTEFHYAIAGPFRVLGVFRCRPGAGLWAEVPDGRLHHVDRRRSAVLHAGLERAVPPDLRAQHESGRHLRQQPAAREGQYVPVRRGIDVLGANGRRMDGLEAILRGSLYLRSRGQPV